MDECQYAVYKGFLKIHYFGTKEDNDSYLKSLDALGLSEEDKEKKIKKEHPSMLKAKAHSKTLDKPSAIGHDNDGVYYVTEDNVLSQAITTGIAKAVDQFKLKVELGMEWVTGNNWRRVPLIKKFGKQFLIQMTIIRLVILAELKDYQKLCI